MFYLERRVSLYKKTVFMNMYNVLSEFIYIIHQVIYNTIIEPSCRYHRYHLPNLQIQV